MVLRVDQPNRGIWSFNDRVNKDGEGSNHVMSESSRDEKLGIKWGIIGKIKRGRMTPLTGHIGEFFATLDSSASPPFPLSLHVIQQASLVRQHIPPSSPCNPHFTADMQPFHPPLPSSRPATPDSPSFEKESHIGSVISARRAKEIADEDVRLYEQKRDRSVVQHHE